MQFLRHLAGWGKAGLRMWSRHPITTITVVATIALLIGLKQTSRILTDVPWKLFVAPQPDKHTVIAAGLVLYIATLLGLYAAFVLILLSAPPESSSNPVARRPSRVRRLLRHLLRPWHAFRGLPEKLAHRLGPRRRFALSWALLAASLAALVLYALPTRTLVPIPLYSLAMFAGAGAWWLGRGRFDAEDDRERRWCYAMGVGVFALTTSLAVSELLWWSISSRALPLSWQVYGYWAFLHVCCFAVAVAAVIDAYGTTRLGRDLLATATIVVMLYVASRPVRVGQVDADEARSGAVGESSAGQFEWFRAVHERLNGMTADDPVLLVAASGGGSRAALYATLVLEALERTPVVGDPILDWREKVKDGDSLADRVLFVSSVSGGSLASAHFAAAPVTDEAVRQPRNTLPEALEDHFTTEWRKTCPPQSGRTRPDGSSMARALERYCKTVGQETESARTEPEAKKKPPQWPRGSTRFDQLASDFNAPLLRGAIHPGLGRGQSVSRFWEDRFDWNEELPGTTAPILLVNMTNVERGSRLVAGFPRLPPGLLGAVAKEGDTRRLTMSEFDPPAKVSLHTATRMSANFPLGFALPELESGGQAVLATDGGVLDNTGVDTLHLLFERLDSHASEPGLLRAAFTLALSRRLRGRDLRELCETAAREPERWREAIDDVGEATARANLLSLESRCLMDRLSARGAVLLEIDSGAKPESTGWLADLFASTTLPFTALSRSAYVRSIKSVGTYAQSIQRYLRLGTDRQLPAVWDYVRRCVDNGNESGAAAGSACSVTANPDGPAAPSGFEFSMTRSRLEHIAYSLDTEHLMTAWSMSSKDKGELLARFLAEDAGARIGLRRSFDNLRGANQLRCGLISWAADRQLTQPAEFDHVSSRFRSLSYAQMDLERHHRVEDEWRRAEQPGTRDPVDDTPLPTPTPSRSKYFFLGYYFDPSTPGAPRVAPSPKDRVGLWCPDYLPPLSGEPDDSLPRAQWLIRSIDVEPHERPGAIVGPRVTIKPGYLLSKPMDFFLAGEQIVAQGTSLEFEEAGAHLGTGLHFGCTSADEGTDEGCRASAPH